MKSEGHCWAGDRHPGTHFRKLTVKQSKNGILGPRVKEELLAGRPVCSYRQKGWVLSRDSGSRATGQSFLIFRKPGWANPPHSHSFNFFQNESTWMFWSQVWNLIHRPNPPSFHRFPKGPRLLQLPDLSSFPAFPSLRTVTIYFSKKLSSSPTRGFCLCCSLCLEHRSL